MTGKAARRYAKAFLEVSLEQGKLDRVREDFRAVRQRFDENRDLELFLKSPVIRAEKKRAAMDEIFSPSLDELSLKLLDFVIEKRRSTLMTQVVDGFLTACKVHAGEIDVQVRTAVDLSDKEQQRLVSILQKQLSGTIFVKPTTDPSIIAGMTVQIEDTIVDGSVKHKLDRLANRFKEAAL